MAGATSVLREPTPAATVRSIDKAADALGFTLLGHNDLGGHGDAFQAMRHGDHVYVGHVGASPAALSILD